jgi:hypothetical protein
MTLTRPKPGDWLVVAPRSTADTERRGMILEILGGPGHQHYRVRWDEEHVSIYYPSGGFWIESARDPCEIDDPEC